MSYNAEPVPTGNRAALLKIVFGSVAMKELQASLTAQWILSLIVAALICCFVLTTPSALSAQEIAKEANGSQVSDLRSRRAKYRSVVAQLVDIESKILKMKSSNAQREFEGLKSTLEGLLAKRKLLLKLEGQWTELSEGKKPALEIDPTLNSSEQSKRQMLVELESSKENVLRLKTEILKLSSEFGPGHPDILDVKKELSDMRSVIQNQTEALEELGVEVKSSVAREKLRGALLRQVELKSKFGAGHPRIVEIESEIAMLKGEIQQTPKVPAINTMPSIELVLANLELREASTKYGDGHPILKSLRQKIEVLEKIAQTEAAEDAPVNVIALAKRLEARIASLQTQIFDDEAKLDSRPDKRVAVKQFEKTIAQLMKQRESLSAELERLAPDPAEQLEEKQRVRLSKQLLSGIDALESLGKSDEANRLREILAGLEN